MTALTAVRVWSCVLALLALGAVCRAQGGGGGPPVAAGPGEISLDVDQFGVGGVVRPGDWCGVRVRVADSSPKPRPIVVQLSIPDADSDQVVMQREITTNPGVVQATWMYLRLPFTFRQGDVIAASAYEALETGGRTGTELRAGKLLGTNRLISKGVIDPAMGMIGVIGPRALGLHRYAMHSPSGLYPVFGHEVSEVVSGLTPADLPDRWTGLCGYEVIVWGSGSPGELGTDRAEALKEWVRRGGHLIIVLPAVGETWSNPAATKLHDLIPSVTINRREGVDLNPYRPLISPDESMVLPRDGVVYGMTRTEGASVNDAMIVLAGPNGEGVVSRRLYGSGMVTLVGLDLNNPVLTTRDVVDASVFWHRVLGRRGKLPSAKELDELKDKVPYHMGEREFDSEVASLIAKSGEAAKGVLLGLVVFGAYWVVAGPLSFTLLKRRGWVRHSWLAFFAIGAAFTGIAWGGASMIRKERVSAYHFTLIDHVFGQPVERARTWISVLIPWYGQASVGIGSPKDAGSPERAEFTNLLTPWDTPEASGRVGSFPDARGYVVDTRAPSRLPVPVRATVKQLQADWAGGPVWKMPFPVVDSTGTPQKLTVNARPAQGQPAATGLLTHQLPGTLKHVTIIVVAGQTPLSARGNNGALLIGRARMYNKEDWAPDEVLDLAAETAKSSSQTDARVYFESLRGKGAVEQMYPGNVPDNTPVRASEALARLADGVAFFSQLEPPNESQSGLGSGAPTARRRMTHTWDLGRWMTHPCIIIVGVLGDERTPAPSPVPFYVDGEALATEGQTVVRWIYPLPDDPPALPRAQDESPAPAGPSRG